MNGPGEKLVYHFIPDIPRIWSNSRGIAEIWGRGGVVSGAIDFYVGAVICFDHKSHGSPTWAISHSLMSYF